MILQQSVNYNRVFLMVLSSDHITGATGKTVTVALSQNGNTFAGATGLITEIGNGYYFITYGVTDVAILGDLDVHCTASGCDPTNFTDQLQTQVFTNLSLNSSGQINVANSIKQNSALNGFSFVMTLLGSNLAATGLTVTAQRSLAGAAFAPCTNSVTELGKGVYSINLAAADTNAATVALRFTATGANDQDILLITQP